MSGLGIVLEEAESSSTLQSSGNKSSASSVRESQHMERDIHSSSESLLPPLPDNDDHPVMQPSRSKLGLEAASVPASVPATASAQVSSDHLSALFTRTSHSSFEMDQLFYIPDSSHSDMSALKLDTSVANFPSLEAFPSMASLGLTSTSNTTSGTSINTSPLRKLSKIKQGIRKLSLSRIGSSAALAASSSELPTPVKPSHSPTQYEFFHDDCESSSSAANSVRSSTFSSVYMSSNSAAGPNQNLGVSSTAVSTPLTSSHMHTSSQGSSSSAIKVRKRTISSSNSTSSATPPVPSPIVTLSENVSMSNKNLATIEQNFFDNWCYISGTSCDSCNSASYNSRNGSVDFGEDTEVGSDDKLAMLNTPDDLLEYSVYLSEHKKSIESAFEGTRTRLINSGWCSNQDLENLNLQRDVQVNYIEQKLAQIEGKLNNEFQLSMVCDKPVPRTTIKTRKAVKMTLSPSLKDLESRCSQFPSEHDSYFQ